MALAVEMGYTEFMKPPSTGSDKIMFSNDDLILQHFTPSEFREWWPLMDPALLVRLDAFRSAWGASIRVSGHSRALGRRDGPDSQSDHNIDFHGVVRGADAFPHGLTRFNADLAKDLARKVGLSSIGLYPHWSSPGLHLGVRESTGLAQWGAISRNKKQIYVTWEEALKEW